MLMYQYLINAIHPRWRIPYGCTCHDASTPIPRAKYTCQVCVSEVAHWWYTVVSVSPQAKCTKCHQPCSGYVECGIYSAPLGSVEHAIHSHGIQYVCGRCRT